MKLPNEFVAFINGARVFKFTKTSSNSYSKYVWNKEWVFDDDVDESTALFYYRELETFSETPTLVDRVLAHKYSEWDLPKCTIREYLIQLAKTLWEEGDGFSGKRPFGNSGWQTDVMGALADGGFIEGTKDEDGYWENLDEEKGNQIILDCFERLKKGDI